MGTQLIPYEEDRGQDGPKMRLLNDMQRRFVMVMLSTAPRQGQEGAAALTAGYAHKESGYDLIRNPKVLEAIHEESAKKVMSAVQVGIGVMLEIALDPTHKDRYKAAKDLAGMNGFSPVAKQEIKVEHTDNTQDAKIARIVENARKLGVDPQALLGQAGIVIDAEFEVIEHQPEEDPWTV